MRAHFHTSPRRCAAGIQLQGLLADPVEDDVGKIQIDRGADPLVAAQSQVTEAHRRDADLVDHAEGRTGLAVDYYRVAG